MKTLGSSYSITLIFREKGLCSSYTRKDSYELGSAYGHVAYQVDSLDDIAQRLDAAGLAFSWGPGETPDGKKVWRSSKIRTVMRLS